MIKFLKRFYAVLILLFLYLPMITLVVLSFNASKSRAKWGGFSFIWYKNLFHDSEIMKVLLTTLLVAFVSAVVACIIGTIAAIGMNRMKPFTRSALMGVTNIPMLNADIVTGISLMLLFLILKDKFGFRFGIVSILLSHITFNIPYVILSVMPRIKKMNPSNYEAALDLGATPAQALRKVLIPGLRPGMVSGFILAFTMSLDDFAVTFFTRGTIGLDTLSTYIYTDAR